MASQVKPNNMIKSCVKCKYFRKRSQIRLFDSRTMQTAAALKAQMEWEQEIKQRTRQEMERYKAGAPFNYEPHSYAWCQKETPTDDIKKAQSGDNAALERLMQNGGAEMNPVSGEILGLYILCDWKNPNNDCEDYDEK